jgi:hypothetical protein
MTADPVIRRIMQTGDPLPAYQRQVAGGKAVRLHVPMRDVIDLRRCALIGQAAFRRVELLTHSRTLSDYEVLSNSASAINHAGRALRETQNAEEFLKALTTMGVR